MFKVELLLEVSEIWWIDIADFRIKIDRFNVENRGNIRAKVIGIKELKKKQ